jgi:WD40 repeat protein/serine/threonine protein kinase
MTASGPDNEAIFHAAREIHDRERRREYIRDACGGDEARIALVEALLAAADVPDSLLDRPAGSDPGATMARPAAESTGTTIGPYKLIEQIGEGGMGIVWMAQQTEPVRRVVALKLIKAGMDSRQVIARFEAERQALALMDHANIARVLDGGTTKGEPGGISPGRPYFVMDLVKGVPITKYCDEHRLTPRQRLELFLPVCQAVQHAHQKGIIHRDLKPSNVLVALYDGKPVPKVIDFGVAKAAGQSLTEKTLVTGFGNIVGTLEYMSPEQAEINQLDIDTRSDIYSLGVLLYELLTGSPPFTKNELEKVGMLEMLRVIREQEPSKPSTKLSTADGLPTLAANRGTEPGKLTKLVRGELDWIVMKALEKDRSRRYETANGFAMDVQRYLADEPVQACPPSAGYRLRKFVRRNKGAVLAATFVLGMLIAMLGVALASNYKVNDALADRNEAFTKLEGEQEKTADALRRETGALTKQTEALAAKTKALEDLGKSQQETQTANATLKEAFEREQQAAYQHRIALAHYEWFANNPVRSLQLLEECPEKCRDWEWRFLYRLHHTDLLTLSAGAFVDDVAYSPDGRLLASGGAVARVWEVRTGRLLFTLKGHTKQVHRVVFSPDGSRLATASLDGSLRVWDAATGEQLVSIERPVGNLSKGLAFTPDSRQIGCDEGWPGATVKFWDAATGKEALSWQPEAIPGGVPIPPQLKGLALSPDGKYLAAFGFFSIWLVDVQTKKAIPLKVLNHSIQRVIFSPDGSRLAAAGGNGQVRIWQVPTGNVLSTMFFRADRIWGLAFSPDGRWLAAASADHTVQVVNAADGRTIMALRGHAGVVYTAAFHPNGRQLASAGTDGTVRLWDITAPQEGPRLTYPAGWPIRRAEFSDDSQRVTAMDVRLLTWELMTGRNLFARTFDVPPGEAVVSALSQDGRYVALGQTFRGKLFVFEAKTGKEIFAQPGNKLTTRELAFSPDGRLLVDASDTEGVRVRDAHTGHILQSLQNHRSGNTNVRVAFSPDGARLAFAGFAPKVKIWDTGSWQERHALEGHRTHVLSLGFSRDSHWLATGGYDKKICVWEMSTGAKLFDLSGQADHVACVTFSPDKKRLFSCGSEGSINIWDVQNRVKLLTLHHQGQFVAVSPDGCRLATCTNESSTLQVWDSVLLSQEERWKRHQQRIPFWQPQSVAKLGDQQ